MPLGDGGVGEGVGIINLTSSCTCHITTVPPDPNTTPSPLCHHDKIFEAMGDYVPEPLFYEWAMPCMRRIAEELRARHPGVPLLVFPRGATYSLAALQVWIYENDPPACEVSGWAVRAKMIDFEDIGLPTD